MQAMVSTRGVRIVTDLAGLSGLSPAEMVDGLPFGLDDLRASFRRVAWADYVEVVERFERACGTVEQAGKLLEDNYTQATSDATPWIRLFDEPAEMYAFLHQTVTPLLWPPMRAQVTPTGERRIEIRISLIDPSARGSAAVFRLSGVAMRTLTEHMGLPRAQVEADVGIRGGHYVITLPDPVALQGRRGGLSRRIGRRVLQAMGAGRVPSDVFSERWRLIEEIGRELAAQSDRVQLTGTLSELLEDYVGCRLHALVVGAGDTREVWAQHPLREGEGMVAVDLVHRGHGVGRLEVSIGESFDDGVAMLDTLAPWLALAVEHVAALETLRDRQTRIERETAARVQAETALLAALDELPGPALVLDADGSVRAANAAGSRRLERERDALLAEIAAAGHGAQGALRIVPIESGDASQARLVIAAGDERAFERRLQTACDTLHLTPRQIDVLRCVCRGLSNKEIANELHCAEVTVETHLTQLLRKAGVDGRTALVIKVLSIP